MLIDAGLEVKVKDPPKGMIPPGTQLIKPKAEPQPNKVWRTEKKPKTDSYVWVGFCYCLIYILSYSSAADLRIFADHFNVLNGMKLIYLIKGNKLVLFSFFMWIHKTVRSSTETAFTLACHTNITQLLLKPQTKFYTIISSFSLYIALWN